MMSLPAMFFGDRFCLSRKGGIEGGGWVHSKGVVRVMYLLRVAEITSGSSFEPNNPREQKLGYV